VASLEGANIWDILYHYVMNGNESVMNDSKSDER